MPRNAAKSLHILWVGKERRCQSEEESEEEVGPLVTPNEFALQRLPLIFLVVFFSPSLLRCVSV